MSVTSSGVKIDILSVISENEKSIVNLAADEQGNLYIYKIIRGENKAELYRRIHILKSEHFAEIIGVEYSGGDTIILEKYIEGTGLDEILDSDISHEDGVIMMNMLCEALCELHGLEPLIVHRDIKPENIIIDKTGMLRLIDFDAAREFSFDGKSSDTRMLGTRGYASPEQYGFSQTDGRSDIYSAGIVLSQICDRMKSKAGEKKRLKKVIDKATMFDPAKRFGSAIELANAMKKATKGTDKRIAYIAIGLTSFCLLMCAVVFGMRHPDYRKDVVVYSKTGENDLGVSDSFFMGKNIDYAYATYSLTKYGPAVDQIVIYKERGVYIVGDELQFNSSEFDSLQEGYYAITVCMTDGSESNVVMKIIP